MERIKMLKKKAMVISTICLISTMLLLIVILALKFVLTAEAGFYTLCIIGLLSFVGIMLGMYKLGHADGKLEEAKQQYESESDSVTIE